jgi:small conductance mechanosensitive channel
VIKARFKTLPSQQWLVGREMNARILKRFGEARIEMPFPTQTIQLAPDAWVPPRDDLKQVVREVLKKESA